MEPTRTTRFDLFIAVVGSALLTAFVAIAFAVSLQSCSPRHYPHARPKYGEPTTPVGPDKSHFSKPKFQ